MGAAAWPSADRAAVRSPAPAQCWWGTFSPDPAYQSRPRGPSAAPRPPCRNGLAAKRSFVAWVMAGGRR